VKDRLVGEGITEPTTQPTDPVEIAKQLARIQRDLAVLDGALAEIQRVKAAGETVDTHIMATDPRARVTPSNEGGFAPKGLASHPSKL
jgi:hypothetical protein